MKLALIGESCTDCWVFGSSERLDPASVAPIFIGKNQEENYGMCSNVYRNVLSILQHKYRKDNDQVDLITNFSTRDFITKTRYVIERKNTTLIRVDVGDKNFGHVSDYYPDWKTKYEWDKYDGIIISDYNKSFLTDDDIEFIVNNNKNVFIDTKKYLKASWAEKVLFIKINNFEFDRSKNSLNQTIKDRMIITLGSNGASYQDRTFPVKKIGILNTCGSGDTFMGSFVISYLKHKDVEKAIKFANKCATLVVSKQGVSVPFGNE